MLKWKEAFDSVFADTYHGTYLITMHENYVRVSGMLNCKFTSLESAKQTCQDDFNVSKAVNV